MTAAAPGTAMIVDDHALFAHGVAMLLQHSLGLQTEIVGSVEAALARLAAGQRYCVALLDLELPGLSGLEGVQRLLAVDALLPIVVCSSHGADAARQAALGRGARAFVGKGEAPEQLLAAVRRARLGNSPVADGAAAPGRGDALTARQREVLWLVTQGKSNKVIARQLGMSENTVRNHVAAILERLGVQNRHEAATAAQRLGLLMPGGAAP